MTRAMLRHEILINDMPQTFRVLGRPVNMAADSQTGIVEFWAEGFLGDNHEIPEVTYQIFGTGQPLPVGARWAGTSDRDRFRFVWHLYELVPVRENVPTVGYYGVEQ